MSLEDAIAKAETLLNGKFNEWPATLEFVAKQDGTLSLTHVVQIQNDKTGAWFEAFVDAHSNELVHVTDFVTKATVSCAALYIVPMLISGLSRLVPCPPRHQGDSP